MSKCIDLLGSLHRKGVHLWLDDDERLRYRSGKGVLTSAEIDALRSMRIEVIDVLRQRQQGPASLPKATGSNPASVPLTLQQTWMWQAIQGGSLSYLNTYVFRISGQLHAERLQRSVEEVMRRHDSLRMRITPLEGVPRQHAGESVTDNCRLPITDLSGLAPAERDARIHRAIKEGMHQGCDLATGPVFATRLLRISEREHFLMWSCHHIVSDAFALGLTLRELWLVYRELANDPPQPLQPATQYADYAIWQQYARRSSSWERNESYWTERLHQAVPIRWPADMRAAETVELGLYEHVPISFGRTLSGTLRRLAAQAGTTVAMATLAAYAMLISRCCNQTDFAIAMTVTGRDRPELERMAGYCAYAVYVRVQLTGDDTFVSMLQKVTTEFHQAFSHGDFGARVARDPELHAHTLFQWLSWPLDEPAEILAKLELKAEWLPVKIALDKNSPFSQYDLQFALWENEAGIGGKIYCRTSVLSAVERFTHALRAIAEELTQDPYRHIARNALDPAAAATEAEGSLPVSGIEGHRVCVSPTVSR